MQEKNKRVYNDCQNDLFVCYFFADNCVAEEISNELTGDFAEELMNIKNVTVHSDVKNSLETKIIKSRREEECPSASKYCPTENLFIVVKTLEEAPSYKIYKLRNAFGWEVKSVSFSGEGYSACSKVTLIEKVLSSSADSWDYEDKEICLRVLEEPK
ncbi:hypothetical protein [Psychrosphaera algicola]|uniref:Uncharacterized protein n=1 Tax=Psychrosphaera algicola TaxID=3023714 RepID=A0ABT5FHY8_9GAMM|nr:hypothetical protein [Psychrosphaera sp. G1-22]MDC2890812.1 hypothetical protein [Psychrosphaera sp. G1-22]